MKQNGFLVFFFFSLFLFMLFLRFKQVSNNIFIPENGEFTGVILEEPEVKGGTQRFTINRVEVVTGRWPEYHYGDRVKFQIPITNDQSIPNSLNSKIYYPKIKLIDQEEGSRILRVIYEFRRRVVSIYQRVLPEPEASLLTGIVLGVKSNLPRDFYEALKNTGTMHVVVASGMNITFVVGFLMFLLTRFLNRRTAIFLSFLGILFYMALASFSAPIVRAGIMGFLALSAQVIGRQSLGIVSLTLTVLAMLLFNPLYVFDVGFQLSVTATAGLLFIQPILLRWKMTKKIFSVPLFGESLTTTLAAQLSTLPILFVNFGRISLLSPIVNALILWVVPIVMIFGAIIGFIGFIFLPLAQFVAYIAYGFLFYFVEMVRFFGGLEFGIFTISKPSAFIAFGYYLILIAILLSSKVSKQNKTI